VCACVYLQRCARDPSDLCWHRVGSGWRSRLFGVVRRIAGLCASGPKASVQCLSNTLSRPCLMSKTLKFINGDTLKVRYPRVVSHLSVRAITKGSSRKDRVRENGGIERSTALQSKEELNTRYVIPFLLTYDSVYPFYGRLRISFRRYTLTSANLSN
jgi:hypothetical protein